MKMLKQAFPKSVALQYINFMPGDYSQNDKVYMKSLYIYAQQIKMGVGGPDIKVYRKMQMDNSYGLIRKSHGIVTTGVAVQDGNYAVINPMTGKQVTLPEILDFAQNYLRLDYVFWCTEEPYYSQRVLPLLKSIK